MVCTLSLHIKNNVVDVTACRHDAAALFFFVSFLALVANTLYEASLAFAVIAQQSARTPMSDSWSRYGNLAVL
jgi:ABC-type antimicrobial peptide transport system permease subunit